MTVRVRVVTAVSLLLAASAGIQSALVGDPIFAFGTGLRDGALGLFRGQNTSYFGVYGSDVCSCSITPGVCLCIDEDQQGDYCNSCENGPHILSGVTTPPGLNGSFIQPAGGSAQCDVFRFWRGVCDGAGNCLNSTDQHANCGGTYPLFTNEPS